MQLKRSSSVARPRPQISKFEGRDTVVERVCRRRRLRPEQFVPTLLRDASPWHARLLLPLVHARNPAARELDRALAEDIADCRSYAEAAEVVAGYHGEWVNRSITRRWLGIRLSMRRVLREVREAFTGERPRNLRIRRQWWIPTEL